MDRLELSTQEALLAQQSKHSAELATLREQLEESERRNSAMELDLHAMREKLDRARIDSLQARIIAPHDSAKLVKLTHRFL